MRPIGFSTGAIAHADFKLAIRMMQPLPLDAIELSALRQPELFPLLDSLEQLDLTRYSYISIHAPSRLEAACETAVWKRLQTELWRGWPIVVHPDALTDMGLGREFGSLLCIENMDKRKAIGRTAKELDKVFTELPQASFCFDIGHARQCDPTMTEAFLILRDFGSKLRQVHVSEVNTRSKHDPLSYGSILAFEEVAHLIPEEVPLILETPVGTEGMAEEIEKARRGLPLTDRTRVA
jgi:hypothetical protein